MIKLLILSGNLALLKDKFNIEFNNYQKIDEKDLVRFGKTLNLIKQDNPMKVYFAVKDLEFQRFIVFLKFYILLTTGIGSIIDENGEEDKYSIGKLFFKEIPMLIYEIIASIFVVIYFYIKMPIIKWTIYKNK
jgi:hypothetical protein